MQPDGNECPPKRRIKTAFKAVPNCTEMLCAFHWPAALRCDSKTTAATRRQAVGRISILCLDEEDLSLHSLPMFTPRILNRCAFERCGWRFNTFMGCRRGVMPFSGAYICDIAVVMFLGAVFHFAMVLKYHTSIYCLFHSGDLPHMCL